MSIHLYYFNFSKIYIFPLRVSKGSIKCEKETANFVNRTKSGSPLNTKFLASSFA